MAGGDARSGAATAELTAELSRRATLELNRCNAKRPRNGPMTVPHSPKGTGPEHPKRKHQRRSVPQPQSTYGDECSAGRHDHRNSDKIPAADPRGSRRLSAVWLGLAHGTRCSNSHHLRTWAGHCIATAKAGPWRATLQPLPTCSAQSRFDRRSRWPSCDAEELSPRVQCRF